MGKSWLPPTGGRYARVCEELLDMGARIAVRSYSHCPPTSRMYYKPVSTDATGDGRSSAASSSCGEEKKKQQQQAAAANVVFEASEVILYGYGRS